MMSQSEAIEKIATHLQDVMDIIKNINNRVVSLETRMTQVEADAAEVLTLSIDLDAVSGGVENLANEIDMIRSSVENLENDVAVLQEDYAHE